MQQLKQSTRKLSSEHPESYAKQLLTFFEEKAKEAGLLNVELLFGYGSPKVEITNKIAPDHKVDLIICGANGVNAIERLIIGSVSEYIVRHAKCDVLVVRPNN
ncbi:universal stress protein [Desulfosporosinus shakirovi]|uniref:universal stress protein n=1 Tax=Desulfosporosinus shakirovi TaxID=2885154 RepID=UPI001E299C36|nr:universal stress protein [Desulfosporosinus sp. SRJS8]